MSDSTRPAGDRDWLIVGRVSKPHGVHGDLLVEIITDFPERFTDGVRFGCGPDSGPETFHEAFRVRYHRGRWLLKVRDIKDRETVEAWRGRYLFLPEQSLDELPEGYYYEHHLVGMECRDLEGGHVGRITGLEDAGGQTRLVVRRDQREFLVPWVEAIVVDVDLDSGIVTLRPLPGLLDDDAVEA